MNDAPKYHKINFCFADDIVVNAEEAEKAGGIVTSLYTLCTRYKLEIGLETTKL